MEANAKPDLAEQIAGALAWWRDAGVDGDFTAGPQRWIVEPGATETASETTAATAPVPPAQLPEEPLPGDLTAFTAWWMGHPDVTVGGPELRVPPRGPVAAKAMVLVATPEPDDTDRLLSGPQGKLLASLCRAIGWSDDAVYVASLLPHYDPLPDWPTLAQTRLPAIALHHVSLAAPERLLVLGSNIPSLLGHDTANKSPFLPDVNHEARKFPVLAELDLAALRAQPRLKAGLWARLLDWTGKPAT